MESLQKALLELFVQAQAYGLRYQKLDVSDAPSIIGIAALLHRQGVTAKMVREHTDELLLKPEFPTPGDILTACEQDVAASRRQGSKLYRLPPTEKYPLGREIACLDHNLTPEQVEIEWQKSYPEEPRALPVSPELLERRKVLRAEEQEV